MYLYFLCITSSPICTTPQFASATSEILEILKNTEIIAINQDPVVGTAISPFRWGLNVTCFCYGGWINELTPDYLSSPIGRTTLRTRLNTGVARVRMGQYSCW